MNNLAIAKDLTYFCSDVVSLVSPSLVLVTGDLTHAKLRDERWSQQFEEEWRAYAEVLERTRVREKRPWLDIRGNHGMVGVGRVKAASELTVPHLSSLLQIISMLLHLLMTPTGLGMVGIYK